VSGHECSALLPRASASPPRLRHKPWIVAGILLIAGCAFGVGQLYLRSTSLRPALAVGHDVPTGHILLAGDVRVIDGAVDGGVVDPTEAVSTCPVVMLASSSPEARFARGELSWVQAGVARPDPNL